MKKLFLWILLPLLLCACSLSPASPVTLSNPIAPVPVDENPSAQLPPVIVGKWQVKSNKMLETKLLYPMSEYDHDFAFSLGTPGKPIEFTEDMLIYDAMAYPYIWIDSQRLRLSVTIPSVGAVWFVYGIKLDQGELLLLDDRDGSTLTMLTQP